MKVETTFYTPILSGVARNVNVKPGQKPSAPRIEMPDLYRYRFPPVITHWVVYYMLYLDVKDRILALVADDETYSLRDW
jgi:hypothetical protein